MKAMSSGGAAAPQALLRGVSFSAAQLVRLRAYANALGFTQRRQTRAANPIGRHHNRGRGMDYVESRLYCHGDEVRHIDWRASARRATLHTKLYTEERGQVAWLLIDFHAAMRFGTRTAFKSVSAAEAATLIGWATVAVGDRIGAVMVAEQQQRELRPVAGNRGMSAVIQALVAVGGQAPDERQLPATVIGLSALLQCARRVVSSSTQVYVIGDFSRCAEGEQRELRRLRQSANVTCIWVYDTLEAEPPAADRYAISDGVAVALLDTTHAATRERMRQHFLQAAQRMHVFCTRSAIGLIMLRSGDSVIAQLRHRFMRRK